MKLTEIFSVIEYFGSVQFCRIYFLIEIIQFDVVFSITKESIVDVNAEVTKVAAKVEGCTQKDVELHVKVS